MIDHCQQAYLLRLWRSHVGAPWRATLVDVANADNRHHFATLDTLYAFLKEQVNAALARTPKAISFACIGASQLFKVPPYVTSITIRVDGAAGASVGSRGTPGKGGRVDATLAVTPGQIYRITAGCSSSYGW